MIETRLLLLFLSFQALGISPTSAKSIPTRPQVPFTGPFINPHSSNWTSPPHPDTTWHYIFQSASGLLQHWSNTAYPNGHALSLGIIPVGTMMYHGTSTGVRPSSPDWISFDTEHAILFARGEKGALLGLSAIKDMKVAMKKKK